MEGEGQDRPPTPRPNTSAAEQQQRQQELRQQLPALSNPWAKPRAKRHKKKGWKPPPSQPLPQNEPRQPTNPRREVKREEEMTTLPCDAEG